MSYRDWHVGMKVVCIDDELCPTIERGRIYTLTSIFPANGLPDALGRVCNYACTLEEADAVHGLGAFNAGRFRPIETRATDISIFKCLLTNPHVRIEEDA